MKKVLIALLSVSSISSCGVAFDSAQTEETAPVALADNQPVPQEPVPQEPVPQEVPPVAQIPSEPVVDPSLDTGSTNPEEKVEVAQLDSKNHPRYYRGRIPPEQLIVVNLYGENSDTVVKLDIDKPPEDVTPCNSGFLVYNGVPFVDEKYQYNSWWILASNTDTSTGEFSDKTIYYYWAKQLSDLDMGIVPITEKVELKGSKNVKLDLGFAVLPYQWVNRIQAFGPIPVIKELPCEK